MQHAMWAGLASLLVSSTACLDESGEVNRHANQPFHVAVFDHAPSEAEIAADQAQFLAAQAAVSAPTVRPIDFQLPAIGQKLVRIDAATADVANAGTDDANSVKFTGIWQRPDAQVAEDFVLNKSGRDDLDRGTVGVFYYLINVGVGVTDQFVEGKISNTSTDAWRCTTITLGDRNHSGTVRTQSLPFNRWVEAPSRIDSPWMMGNDTSMLTY